MWKKSLKTMPSSAIVRPMLGLVAILTIPLFLLLPAYTIILALITILRATWHTTTRGGGGSSGVADGTVVVDERLWRDVDTSIFVGSVYHVRHRPTIHSFKYPLHFAMIDLDESSTLFGTDLVRPIAGIRGGDTVDDVRGGSRTYASHPEHDRRRGSLWPLSTLMSLRDVDHLRNGEGKRMNNNDDESMRWRITNLIRDRTGGKLDLSKTDHDRTNRRRIILVTHLMYYGYCFNPVSFYFVLRRPTDDRGPGGGEEEQVEAVVVEVSNTPWNEMHVYVLHPDSVDVSEYASHPPRTRRNDDDAASDNVVVHRYKWRKGFHVSPFMTMDHDYDWTFRYERDRIRVEARMIRQRMRSSMDDDASKDDDATGGVGGNGDAQDDDDNNYDGRLYFTAGFDVRRAVYPTSTYPLQLAFVIMRYPVYCLIIQLWIHYEALRLLMKGVEFIPHPDGSETGASRAIAALIGPIFGIIDVLGKWWTMIRRGDEKSKSA